MEIFGPGLILEKHVRTQKWMRRPQKMPFPCTLCCRWFLTISFSDDVLTLTLAQVSPTQWSTVLRVCKQWHKLLANVYKDLFLSSMLTNTWSGTSDDKPNSDDVIRTFYMVKVGGREQQQYASSTRGGALLQRWKDIRQGSKSNNQKYLGSRWCVTSHHNNINSGTKKQQQSNNNAISGSSQDHHWWLK